MTTPRTSIKNVKPLGFPWQTQDPFLFCVFHEDAYPKGNDDLGPDASLSGHHIGQDFGSNKDGWHMYHGSKVPGFPAHPHCGFETVTIVNKGFVDHSDSLGAAGRFGLGDVQWMTAGRGVQHCEMFPLLHRNKENPLELFQIWLNLPRGSKKVAPHFAMLWSDLIPTLTAGDKEGKQTRVRVIAGKIGGVQAPPPAPDSWAADPINEMAIWTISMDPGANWIIPSASPGINRSLYFFEGHSIVIDGQDFKTHQAAELNPEHEITIGNGDTHSRLLLLQGRPIGEPVVQYGPFVTNTEEEVHQVMAEFRKDQFGGWPWGSPEHVHPRERARFAKYPDGREEIRGIA